MTLQGFLIESLGGTDEELFDMRFGQKCGFTNIGTFGVDRHLPPAEQSLSLLFDDLFDRLLAEITQRLVVRQEDISNAVLSIGREFDAEIPLSDFAKKRIRQPGQHSRTVAGVGFATASAAMIHMSQHTFRIHDNLMRRLPFDVGNETDSAVLVFVGGIVETGFARSPQLLARFVRVSKLLVVMRLRHNFASIV